MALSLPAKKILVVDDDPVILKALSWDLEHAGYEVLTAVDGPDAFAVVRRQRPDLILLDIFFPPDVFQSGNTWDAFLIMQWLQRMGESRNRRIPVIVISGRNRRSSGPIAWRPAPWPTSRNRFGCPNCSPPFNKPPVRR